MYQIQIENKMMHEFNIEVVFRSDALFDVATSRGGSVHPHYQCRLHLFCAPADTAIYTPVLLLPPSKHALHYTVLQQENL